LGKKVLKQQKTLEVPLERGSFHGHPITLYGEGDQLVSNLLFSLTPKQET
jgi:hypothetical protein